MGFFDKILGENKSVIGIDIGSSSIKVVQIKKEGSSVFLENYSEIATGPYLGKKVGQSTLDISDSDLTKILEIILKEAKIKIKVGALAIPFRYSLVTLIDIPALAEDKIAQTVPFEARKYIPVPLSEVSIDWFVVPKALLETEESPLFDDGNIIDTEKESRKISLIAIHNKELIKYKKVIKNLNLDIKKLEIEIFSALRASNANNRAPIIIVDIGAKTTKYYLLDHNIILSSHYSKKGGETLTEVISSTENMSFDNAEYKKRQVGIIGLKEESARTVNLFIDEMISEIKNITKDFEFKNRKTVSKIILTGGGALTKGLLEKTQSSFEIDVELSNPFNIIKAPKYLESRLIELGPQFTVSLGVALKLITN